MSQYLKPNVPFLQQNIKHIVVLMLENHSFDHMLGWLYSDKNCPPPDDQYFEGLTDELWNPLDNIDADGKPFIEKVPIQKNGQYIDRYGHVHTKPVNFTLPNPDPGEGFRDTNHQLFLKYEVGDLYPPQPINFGFVQNYQNAMLYGSYTYGDTPTNPRDIMTCYTPEQTPVLSELARNFAVLDHYHCSVPSQTIPNRDFIHAATSTGHVNNDPIGSCDARTIFNQIQDAIDQDERTDLSWGIYGNNDFTSKDEPQGKFGKNHFSLTRVIMTQLQSAMYDDNFGTLDDFKKLCKSGKLPSYSFLEPNYGGSQQNDQHPPTDIRAGEQLIADIYNAIKKSKAFNETLFIITYDEHGGCYDHVPPPEAVNPYSDNRPGQDGFRFNRFGVRVPCVVVNPYIKKGLIARAYGDTPFDHTSVIKTIQNCFNLKGNLTERDKAAPDFSCLLGLTEPRTDFPSVKPLKFDWKKGDLYVNDLHRLIGKMLEKMTGKSAPDSDDLLEYIEKNYDALFNSTKK